MKPKLKTAHPIVSPALVIGMILLVLALATLYVATQGNLGILDYRSQAARSCQERCSYSCRNQDDDNKGQCVSLCVHQCNVWRENNATGSGNTRTPTPTHTPWPTHTPTPTGTPVWYYCVDNNCGRRATNFVIPSLSTNSKFNCASVDKNCSSDVGFTKTPCHCVE